MNIKLKIPKEKGKHTQVGMKLYVDRINRRFELSDHVNSRKLKLTATDSDAKSNQIPS